MQMLEREAGMTTKSRARYQVKRLDNGTILYFADRESAQIYSIQAHYSVLPSGPFCTRGIGKVQS